jgi:hypothetical protein
LASWRAASGPLFRADRQIGSEYRAQIDALEKALDQYRLNMGNYAGSQLGVNALLQRP